MLQKLVVEKLKNLLGKNQHNSTGLFSLKKISRERYEANHKDP